MNARVERMIKRRSRPSGPHIRAIGGDGSEDQRSSLLFLILFEGVFQNLSVSYGKFETTPGIRAGSYVHILPRSSLIKRTLELALIDRPTRSCRYCLE